MFNYFNVAWRQLFKNKLYSLINIGGLGLGLAVSMIILLFVIHEFNYDRFHNGADQIFQVQGSFNYGGQQMSVMSLSAAAGPGLVEKVPDIDAAVRIYEHYNPVIKTNTGEFTGEEQFLLTESSFLEVFSFPLLQGDPQTALDKPNSLLLSPKAAKKYFGNENPIGATLELDETLAFTVTGIIDQAPSYSSIQYDVIASLSSLTAIERMQNPEIEESQITLNNQRIQLGSLSTFLKLGDTKDIKAVEERITEAAETDPENPTTFNLVALTDIHFGIFDQNSSILKYLYLFLGIGFTILLLAMVNFFSLSTANAIKRSKEVSIRKVIGARRIQLIRQFYFESGLITLFAFILGFVLLSFVQSSFFNKLDITIQNSFLYHPIMIISYVALLILCIVVSGSIPSLLMSSYKPIKALRGEIKSGKNGHRIRQSLSVFQFSATLALIICSIFVGKQLKYLQNKSSALVSEQIVSLKVSSKAQKGFLAYKEKILNETGATDLAVSNSALFKNGLSIYFTESPINQEQIPLYFMRVDKNYFNVFNLNWHKEPLDQVNLDKANSMVFNETAMDKIGIPRDSLIKNFNFLGKDNEIVGVLEDFHFQSLHSEINPLALMVVPEENSSILRRGATFYVKFPSGTILSEEIKKLKRIHSTFEPGKVFDFDSLDENIANSYSAERRLATMLQAFTLIAIIISCLGLFGLITFVTERRTKEIGIRKVLGASSQGIIKLLSKDFIILVLIASLIASPIAYYFMQKWLEGFVDQINLSLSVFFIAIVVALALAILTIIGQATKAAIANPVNSLRKD